MHRSRILAVGVVAITVGGPAPAGAPPREIAGTELLAGPLQTRLAPAPETPMLPVSESSTPDCGTFGCDRGGHRHNGVDMTAPAGLRVRAPLSGRVALMAQDGSAGSAGYGNLLCLQHRTRLATCYAHLSRFADGLLVGTLVRRGEQLGEVGSTGFSTGDHLHFEVRRGDASCSACATDPQRWLRRATAPGPVPAARELSKPRSQPTTGDGPGRPGGRYIPIPQRRPAPAPAAPDSGPVIPARSPAPPPVLPHAPKAPEAPSAPARPAPAPAAPVDPGTGGLTPDL